MKIDRVKLEISIVAGILAVLLVSIFLGFALVGGSLTNSDIIKPPINLDDKMFQVNIAGIDPYLSGYNPIVSVAQDDCMFMDTEKGKIDVYEDKYLPNELPLCITQDALNDYNLTVVVTGGYTPVDMMSYVTLYQKKVDVTYTIDVEWKNTTPVEADPCKQYWTAYFKLADATPIILESNQFPDGWNPICSECNTIPGKKVQVRIHAEFQGCWELKQRFVYI
jgi:hypothetical protein